MQSLARYILWRWLGTRRFSSSENISYSINFRNEWGDLVFTFKSMKLFSNIRCSNFAQYIRILTAHSKNRIWSSLLNNFAWFHLMCGPRYNLWRYLTDCTSEFLIEFPLYLGSTLWLTPSSHDIYSWKLLHGIIGRYYILVCCSIFQCFNGPDF